MSSTRLAAAVAEAPGGTHAQSTIADTSSALATHPEFSSPNADVVLRSRDDVLFRVSSDLLRRTSGWLNTMFTLPQASGSSADREDPIPMDESSGILSQLLSIVDGRALPALDDFDELESLLAAAEKYEMPMVISVLRLAFVAHFADKRPLRLYGVACRMGWEKEARDASSRTLTQDLLAPTAQTELAAMAPRHRTMLIELHRRRREAFFAGLDDPMVFYANRHGWQCYMNNEESNNCVAPLDHRHWWALKYALAQRWIQSPLGAELDEAFYCMPEFHDVSRAKCLTCGKHIYGMMRTIKKLNALLCESPRCVDVSTLHNDAYSWLTKFRLSEWP